MDAPKKYIIVDMVAFLEGVSSDRALLHSEASLFLGN